MADIEFEFPCIMRSIMSGVFVKFFNQEDGLILTGEQTGEFRKFGSFKCERLWELCTSDKYQ